MIAEFDYEDSISAPVVSRLNWILDINVIPSLYWNVWMRRYDPVPCAMSDTSSDVDAFAATAGDDADLEELAARVDAQADDLIALLDLLTVVRGLSDELVPELRTAVAENREPLADLRTALENEETMRLVEQVGDNADALADLLDLVVVAQDLSAELVPELRTVAAENRGEIARLRVAFEREETLVLLRQIGDNTDTFLDLLSTLEVASDALADVAPEDEAAAEAARQDVRRLATAFDRAESVEALVALGENMDTVRGLLTLARSREQHRSTTPVNPSA